MCLFYDTRSFLRPVNMCYEVLLPVLSADVTNKLVKFLMNLQNNVQRFMYFRRKCSYFLA